MVRATVDLSCRCDDRGGAPSAENLQFITRPFSAVPGRSSGTRLIRILVTPHPARKTESLRAGYEDLR
jgi:hypothetical protein